MKLFRSHSCGLVPPKPLGVGGFTLIEIMTVVLIVGLLSALAVAGIHRIKELAVRSSIQNNIRQLHAAKEQFFFETGTNQGTTPIGLAAKGYLRKSVSDHVMSGTTIEARMGWEYVFIMMSGQPTYAFQGQDPGDPDPGSNLTVMRWKQPTGEVIWYPAPPAALATAATGSR
jgi:prepilin-type N-terminal cleavage/methylation domain-containing protein